MDLTHRQAAFFIGIIAAILCVACYFVAQTSVGKALLLGAIGVALIWLVGQHYSDHVEDELERMRRHRRYRGET